MAVDGNQIRFGVFTVHAALLATVQTREQAGASILLKYGLLRDKGKVLEWLERFVARHDYGVVYMLKTAPELDFLRGDADFRSLLRRIGLPP